LSQLKGQIEIPSDGTWLFKSKLTFLSSDQEKLFSQSVVLPEKIFQAAEKCVVT